MERRLIVGRWQSIGAAAATRIGKQELRLIVTKASNRAAVHGAKLPVTEILNEEEVEKEIQKGKDGKERKREEVEKA